MDKKMYRKHLAIGLIILFVGASILPNVSSKTDISENMQIAIEKSGPQNLNDMNWTENFDTYANGQYLDGGEDDGGWKGWDSDPSLGANVTDTVNLSAPHSVAIEGPTDLVHEFADYTSGLWTFTAWQYIPLDFTGESYFILLSKYYDGGGQEGNRWAVQLRFDSAESLVESEHGGPNTELIVGRWVEIRTEIDLDTDWMQIFYDGVMLEEKAWTSTPNNDMTGIAHIQAVDLFANAASVVYYDNLSLIGHLTGRPEFNINISGGLGVNVKVKNVGDKDATNVDWEIELEGGLILFGRNKSGRTVRIKEGLEEEYRNIPIGIGRVNITVAVDSDQGATANKKVSATVLLFFVLKVEEI